MITKQYPDVMTRSLPDTDNFRNITVEVRKSDLDPDENHGVEWEVISSHECWTGASWLHICNRDECTSIERAIEIARDMVKSLS